MGNLRMVYDDSCFGARIRVIADDGSLLCDTIVAVQTCLRTERLHAYWSAVDMSIDPNVRRHFQAAFSSPQAIAEFSRIFAEKLFESCSILIDCGPKFWHHFVGGNFVGFV
ncbi:hypothetical protein HPB49_000397 [Dermacentor silvarum]|uniref:Uncharacterized protein n=1 Tax=Dermacentor silvarum TaxID=543639 RepID=A0ACB8D9K0_DERSI|nr:hypothetical protein HPB49_000397 [Dermacentor silvarum]